MLDKLSKYVLAISLLAVAVLAISPIAHADPVHMTCSGGMLLPGNKVNTDSVLSLTIDLGAKTVIVEGYAPLGIYQEGNKVNFIGKTAEGVLDGSVDRVTGEARIIFLVNAPKERFFSGICKPAQKLF